MRHWLNPKPADPEVFAAQVQSVCEIYLAAPALAKEGIIVASTDEKTGMQALERARPTLPMKRGLAERREVEYVRHGTLCLTANLEVATGRLIAPTMAATRTDADFAAHIATTVSLAPESGWVFVVDNLNTHQSEALVRYVATACEIPDELGKKGKVGVLRTMATRATFLTDPAHRIRFVFTPKHCSWLNQIELAFSVIARRLLRRGSFISTDELRARVLAFIRYYNEHWAKPFKWTHTGRPLAT